MDMVAAEPPRRRRPRGDRRRLHAGARPPTGSPPAGSGWRSRSPTTTATPVTAYDEQHERDLHLIVVRRDLTGFQHVHPALDTATGEWSVDVDLTPGAWRVLADFAPTGGEPLVLGADLLVPGGSPRSRSGADRLAAQVDGYDVTLDGDLSPPARRRC